MSVALEKLNARLLVFAGWEYREFNPSHPHLKNTVHGMGWFHPESLLGYHDPPDLTQHLELCIRWLEPKTFSWQIGTYFTAEPAYDSGLFYKVSGYYALIQANVSPPSNPE
jgi:hypothetical protein